MDCVPLVKKKTWISEVTHEGLPSRLHSGRKTAEIHKACQICWAGITFPGNNSWGFPRRSKRLPNKAAI